jgi:hypothetical protein
MLPTSPSTPRQIFSRLPAVALGYLIAGCAAAEPPPLPAPEEPPPEPFPAAAVWTAREGVELRSPVGAPSIVIERGFVRLEPLFEDSLGIHVLCLECAGRMVVDPGEVVFQPLPPEVAAWGELGAFALSIRTAAAERDLERLRRAMAPEFTFSFIGEQNPEAAFAVWGSEAFRSLDAVPELLDQGITTRDGRLWVAPPEFAERLDYRGLRLGFRRSDGGPWEWVFLVRSVAP